MKQAAQTPVSIPPPPPPPPIKPVEPISSPLTVRFLICEKEALQNFAKIICFLIKAPNCIGYHVNTRYLHKIRINDHQISDGIMYLNVLLNH